MSDKTKIEWTDATWNPVTGCTKVSPGCKHCYAERNWGRLVHMPAFAGRAFTDVACHPERLDQPLRWKKPRRVFVNSMSDLFHEDVPDSFIDQVFSVMALAPQHTFQVLTKRPARLRNYVADYQRRVGSVDRGGICVPDSVIDRLNGRTNMSELAWPLPNVWLGVSIEDQATADERIPLLLQTPAAVRWVSAEPLLGPVDLSCLPFSRPIYPFTGGRVNAVEGGVWGQTPAGEKLRITHMPFRIDWLVAGGESGPRARPMHPDWARHLRKQCADAGVPFLFKQWGEWLSAEFDECPCGPPDCAWMWADGAAWSKFDGQRGVPLFRRVGKRAAGRLLDGVQHDGYPGAPA